MILAKKTIFSLILAFIFPMFTIFALPQNFCSAAPSTAFMDMQEGFDKTGEIKSVFGNKTPKDIRLIITKIIKIFLGFVGIIFLIMILLAGYKYMTSGGNKDKASEALKQIGYAAIGLIIILAAYSITVFIEVAVRRAVQNVVW